MKRTLEVALYSVMLSTLAAAGADFSRAELNAKLDALAQSTPPPNASLSTGETCYKITIPPLRRSEYICPECGKRTYYLSNSRLDFLLKFRNDIEPLRKLGLDISLDESSYCQFCTPPEQSTPGQTVPVVGEIIKNAVKFPAGRQVTIVQREKNGEYLISFDDGYLSADLISDNGTILKNAHLRCGPGTQYQSLDIIRKGQLLKKLPPLPNDPDTWVRVACNHLETPIAAELLTNIQEAPALTDLSPDRLAWIITIDGKQRKVPVNSLDGMVLEAFLTGKDRVMDTRGGETPLKAHLPRLQILLGAETTITDTKSAKADDSSTVSLLKTEGN